MTESPNTVTPAGWYVDPMTNRHLRWWNGQSWTESVAPLPGVTPSATVAPAPQVRRRFELESSEEASSTATASTTHHDFPLQEEPAAPRSASSHNTEAQLNQEAQRFVHQVPVAEVRPETAPQQVQNLVPTIAWPAESPAGNESLAAAAAAAAASVAARSASAAPSVTPGTYEQGFSAPKPLDWSESEPAAPVSTATGAIPTLGSASEQAAHSVAAPQPTTQQPSTLSPSAQQPATQYEASATTEADDAHARLEPTVLSRRQLRDRAEQPLPQAPSRVAAASTPDDDVWAGQRDDTSTRTRDTADEADYYYDEPQEWSTAAAWLLAFTPWLSAIAGFVALAAFEPWSLPALGVLAVPWLFGILFAQQDANRLRGFGHEPVASWLWSLLSAPVYLIMRTLALSKSAGIGSIPLWVWIVNALVVGGIAAGLVFAPALVPTFIEDAFEPLRSTAGAWLGSAG